jgi:hypothetical protein
MHAVISKKTRIKNKIKSKYNAIREDNAKRTGQCNKTG